MINSKELYLLNVPIPYEHTPVYMFSFFNIKTKNYEFQWYNQKLEELSQIFTQSQSTIHIPKLDLLITNTNQKELKFLDFLRDLNHVNQFRIPKFQTLPKQDYLDFLLKLYHCKPDLTEFKHRLPKSIKFLKPSIPSKIPKENFQDSKFIAITIQTMDQEVTPYNLMESELWNGLFQFGLIEFYYTCSVRFSFLYFLYCVPADTYLNKKSEFQRFLGIIREHGRDAVNIYTVNEEIRALNPPMVFPVDQIKNSYLNFKLDQTNYIYPQSKLRPNPHRKHITAKNYEFPQIKESLLFSFCYNTNLIIFFPDLEQFPTDLLHFFELNPMNRTFLLEKLETFPNNAKQTKKYSLFVIVALNRYVNYYYETVYRLLSDRFLNQKFLISHIVNFPWTHPTSPIKKIIEITQEVYAENSHSIRDIMFKLPLFPYRMRKSCIALDLRIQLWHLLNKLNKLSRISDTKLNEIRKIMSTKMKPYEIEKFIRSI